MSQGPDDLSNLDQPSIEDGPAKAVIRHEEALARLAEHPDDIDAITNQAKAMMSMSLELSEFVCSHLRLIAF